MSKLGFMRALSLAALAAPVALHAQTKFEGTVTMRMGAAEKGIDMVYSVKGDRLRTDMNTNGMAMYFIREGDKNDIVMPAQKMYMEQSISASMAAVQRMQGRSGTPVKTPSIERTGKKETIAGYECEHIIMTGDDGQLDVCLAQGLGTFAAAGNPLGGRGAAASDPTAMLGKGPAGFPLKMQKVGGETMLLVTKIEKKPLDESLFSVPSEYKKMDMPGMMGRPPQF
jgi:hypothetical protein